MPLETRAQATPMQEQSVSSVALFGPQVTDWTDASLRTVQHSLREDPNLRFLAHSLEQLPTLWPTLQNHLDTFDSASSEGLRQLSDFASAKAPLDPTKLDNVHLAPLTVVSHVVELVRRAKTESGAQQSASPPSLDLCLPDFQAVQGFCIGFLGAIALSTSSDWSAFEENISRAVRLAACLGAVIDAEDRTKDTDGRATSISARWRTDSERTFLEATLDSFPEAYISCITDEKTVTITLPLRDEDRLRAQLSEAKIATGHNDLYGCFHHARHREAAQVVKELCAKDANLQLPSADQLCLPLRSTADAAVITAGPLHEIAIDAILSRRAHWYQTVKATVDGLSDAESVDFVAFGKKDSIIPRTLALRNKGLGQTPGIPNEIQPQAEEIAIVGMACRFPEADSADEFWELVTAGRTAIRPVPLERFDPAGITREPQMPEFWGNFIRNAEAFDHRFFNISGREAKSMDPQQRLALQVAYEALESSGYYRLPEENQNTDVGCYLGIGTVDYEHNVASENANAFSATGTLRAFASGRISHFFGWTGPSITFDTACSSSAVAIHTACKALLADECSIAVAGGVNVMTNPNLFQNLAAASFLDPEGMSKAFDESGNGYSRGEGAGLFVLKPLSRAKADGDAILGIIAGSAIRQGSNCSPLTQSDPLSQNQLYTKVLSAARIDPSEVTYVEAHGTGTLVGDPIEYESVRQTFAGSGRNNELFLGAVKDNIGHAEAASGAAGIVKCIMMMQNKTIAKQASFTRLNPRIKASDKITIPIENTPWNVNRRVALINNYGASGSIAALALREPEQDYHPSGESAVPQGSVPTAYPILLAAKSQNSLKGYISALGKYAAAHGPSIADLAYSVAWQQNPAFEYRAALTAFDATSLASALGQAMAESESAAKRSTKQPVVLCFGGQTGDVITLSKDLYDASALLRHYLDQCDAACRDLDLPSIFPGIFDNTPVEDLVSLHCRLFSLQFSSAKCWLDSGVKIDSLIGHSFGQLTALCVADSMSLKDGLRLISGRARLMRDEWSQDRGVMLSVEGDRPEIESLVHRVNSQQGCSVDFACYNGPRAFVLAGDTSSIDKLEEACQAAKSSSRIKTTRLKNSRAYHSYLVEPMLSGLADVARSIRLQPPRIHIEACYPNGTSWNLNTESLVQHTRQPVYFSDAVQRITERVPSAIWLEAGSASPVIAMIRRIVTSHPSSGNVLIPVDLGTRDATKNLANATCQLWKAGSQTKSWLFHRLQQHDYTKLILPPYQFEKTKHWIEYRHKTDAQADALSARAESKERELVSLIQNQHNQAVFLVETSHPIFDLSARGHAVAGQSLCPASMYVELAARCATALLPTGSARRLPQIEDLTMSAPLGLSAGITVFVNLAAETPDGPWTFAVVSRPQTGYGETEHARGSISLARPDDVVAASRLKLLKRLARPSRSAQIRASPMATGLSGPMVYKVFRDVVEYAPYYHGVKHLTGLDNEAVGIVTVPTKHVLGLEAGVCDPISLDNFLQVAGIHVNCLSDRRESEVFMCTAVEEVFLSAGYLDNRAENRSWTVYTRYDAISRNSIANDIFVFDSDTQELVLSVMGATFKSVPFKAVARSLSRLNTISSPTSAATSPKSSLSLSEQDHEDLGYRSLTPRTPIDEEMDFSLKSSSMETLRPHVDFISLPKANVKQPPPKANQMVQTVRQILSEIIEIPLAEVPVNANFEDLGIDSLLVTEVLTEIQKHLRITMTPAEFQECPDIPTLCRHLEPEAVPAVPITNGSTKALRTAASNVAVVAESSTLRQDPVKFARVSNECFATVKQTYDSYAKATGFANFRADVFPLQSQLVVQYVVEAFASLGCDISTVKAGSDIPALSYIPKHVKLVRQMYKVLEEAGLVIRANDAYQRTETKVSSVPSSTILATMLARFPQHTAETKLLHSTAHQLAECLSGTADPIGILFGDASARSLLEDMYTNAPMFKAGTLLLADYLSSVLGRFGDPKRPVHILELGAGTGGTTKKLLEVLTASPNGQNFTYTFTDLSSSLVAAAKRKFAKYPFMRYSVLDIEVDPESSGLLGQFDIVISTNCIHATRDLVASTRHIRQMLRPDGILCLVEATRNLFWFDLVFGLLEGWWLATDGRDHPLADEHRWERDLKAAGFRWVDWSDSPSEESDVLRVITASPSEIVPALVLNGDRESSHIVTKETLVYKEVNGLGISADIYYPAEIVQSSQSFPVALMIHGGGHVLHTRDNVRPEQTKMLLQRGFLPVSIDYRLCPETTLSSGPMRDVADALAWIQESLPLVSLQRKDVRVNAKRVVAVGWSTGGTLAMSLGWTSLAQGIRPPDAILSFYSPTDYEDPFWLMPNIPTGSEAMAAQSLLGRLDDEIWEGIHDEPITGYTVPATKRAYGVTGGLTTSDARTRLALYMNWHGKALHVLVNGLNKQTRNEPAAPTPAQIEEISPLAHIKTGGYASPTFIIHPRKDDLIPWQQSQRTVDTLKSLKVDAELRLVDDVPHLFDVFRGWDKNEAARQAVHDGYEFLVRHV